MVRPTRGRTRCFPRSEPRGIVGLLGPNGAGKTTSFYMLTGIIKPSSGRVLLEDQDIGTWPLHERARVGISYLPQESSVFRKLTVRQNLQIILEHTGLSRKEQKERAALIREPKFVLLDEPFAGIDPLAVGDIQGLVRALRDRGIGVLISDHNVRETLTICDRAYLMVQGQVVLSGTPETIVNNEQARSVYLGEGFSL